MNGRCTRVHCIHMLILLGVAMLMSGCWNYLDIDRRGIVLGIGIERVEGQLQVTIDVANPETTVGSVGGGSTSTGGKGPLILMERGSSLNEIWEQFESQIDRHLYLKFLQVVVIHESVAREGFEDIVDYVRRSPLVSLTPCFYLTSEPIEKIIGFSPVIGHDPSIWLHTVSDNFREQANFPRCIEVWRLIRSLSNRGIGFMPRLVWRNNRPALWGAGIHVMDEQGRLQFAGWLDAEEYQGSEWWNNRIDGATARVPCGKGYLVAELRQNGRKIELQNRGNSISIRLEVRAEAAIREISQLCKMELKGKDHFQWAGDQISKEILRKVFLALQKARQMRADFLGIGNKAMIDNPQLWNEMKQQSGSLNIPQMLEFPVEAIVKVNVAEMGEIR